MQCNSESNKTIYLFYARIFFLIVGNNRMWETGDQQPESNDKIWDELSPVEQKAAGLLGYSKKSWNGDNETESSVDEKKSSDDSSGVGSENWASLSKEAKSAAKVLGYTSSLWNNDGSAPSESKDWKDLSSRERTAAQTLGYTEKKWNGEDDDETDNTPKPSEGPSICNLTKESSQGSVLEQIISGPGTSNLFGSIASACSFDSNSDAETVTSAMPSVTGISNGIASLFGFSIDIGHEELELKERPTGQKDP